jgi:hypothetical protein
MLTKRIGSTNDRLPSELDTGARFHRRLTKNTPHSVPSQVEGNVGQARSEPASTDDRQRDLVRQTR